MSRSNSADRDELDRDESDQNADQRLETELLDTELPEAELQQAVLEYKAAIESIRAAGDLVSIKQIKAAIDARDRIHRLATTKRPTYQKRLKVQFMTLVKRPARRWQTSGVFVWLQNRRVECSRKLSHLHNNLQRRWQSLQQFLAGFDSQSSQIRQSLKEVKQLDDDLRTKARLIRRVVEAQRVVPVSGLREILEHPQPKWAQLIRSSKPWYDRYDWLWRGISLVCFIWAVALLVDTINRFLTGGISTGGIAAILGTVLLTLLSSGGAVTSFGQGELERVFESFEIAPKWWDEVRCLISVFALVALILLRHCGLPIASVCYANEPPDSLWNLTHCFSTATSAPFVISREEPNRNSPKIKSVKVQESRYQRSIALDPSNFDPYFKLASLYERELDYDNALKTYQMAAYIGKALEAQEAEMGVVRMLIKKDDLDNAAERLEESLKPIQSCRVDNAAERLEESLKPIQSCRMDDAQYEALKQLGQAYLEKGRQEKNALQELQTSLIARVDSYRQTSLIDRPSKNENLAAAVKWFEQGLERTANDELQLQQNYQMNIFLAWAYWEQRLWTQASANADKAITEGEKLSKEDPRSQLPICIRANAEFMINGSEVTSMEKSAKFKQLRRDLLSCAGSKEDLPEFQTITEQIKQLNEPLQRQL